MRKLTLLLLLVVISAVLGWYAHDSLAPVNPPLSIQGEYPPETTALIPPAIDHEKHQTDQEAGLVEFLQSGAFPAALDSYEALLEQNDADAIARARTRILSHASWLLDSHDYTAAKQLLNSFLMLEYRDVETHILLAEVYLHQNAFISALEHYYVAKGHAYRNEILEKLNALIRNSVNAQAAALRQNKDYSGLLQLYRFLTQLEPDYAPFFIGLADAQLALDDPDAARRSLQLVRHDADVGTAAQAMLAKLQTEYTPSGSQAGSSNIMTPGTGIALHRRANQFLVDSELEEKQSIRLMIDTGASMTIITPEILGRYGRSMQTTGKTSIFMTANGPVRAPVYRVDSLSVGDWEISNLEVGVLALDDFSEFDGLLGMNFLRHFQFFIDQNKAILHLSPN